MTILLLVPRPLMRCEQKHRLRRADRLAFLSRRHIRRIVIQHQCTRAHICQSVGRVNCYWPHIFLSQDSERLGPRLAVTVMNKLLLVLDSTVILGSESHGNHDHILLCHNSGSSAALTLATSVCRFHYCWPSPAQSFLQVSSRFVANICILS
jgi:hypothetical protein